MSIERELLKRFMIELTTEEDVVSLFNDIKECLAQPEQEPVAWKDRTYGNLHHVDYGNSIPLYISPPKREPLSDGEIRDGLDGKNGFENWYDDRFVDGVRFAEKHHGIGGRL